MGAARSSGCRPWWWSRGKGDTKGAKENQRPPKGDPKGAKGRAKGVKDLPKVTQSEPTRGHRGHRPAKGEPKGAKSLSERAKGEPKQPKKPQEPQKDTHKGALIGFRGAPEGPKAQHGKPPRRQAHF